MNIYTIEKIYKLIGKDDKTASLILRKDSETYAKFGHFVVVVCQYTQKERESLDENYKDDTYNHHGYIRAKYLGSDIAINELPISSEIQINTEDIISIWGYNGSAKNTFHSKELREIERIEIPIKSLPQGMDYDWMYGFKKRQIQEEIGLSPQEEAFYLASKLYYEPEMLSDNEKFLTFSKDGIIVDKIEWELLQIKYNRQDITDNEKSRLLQLYDLKKKNSYGILNKYLLESGSSLKKLVKNNIDQAAKLLVNVLQFHDRRFTVTSKYPIYLDINGYLHIYMRHVETFKINSHFENKDNFQWNEDDVFSVMNNVIKEIEKEYENFREINPQKRYSRYGNESVYFEGDYYTLHIEPNGSLSTFHKNRKDHER